MKLDSNLADFQEFQKNVKEYQEKVATHMESNRNQLAEIKSNINELVIAIMQNIGMPDEAGIFISRLGIFLILEKCSWFV